MGVACSDPAERPGQLPGQSRAEKRLGVGEALMKATVQPLEGIDLWDY